MNPLVCKQIPHIHHALSEHFGPLHWWPAETPFEVAIGAILTQNTAWSNVEKAIHNLRGAEALAIERLAQLPIKQLEELIKPSGFFRQKALRLHGFAEHLANSWHSDLEKFCSGPLEEARARLLARPGIGPETADSILLYAAGRPSFVVDAYTRRIFARIGLFSGKEKYDDIRQIFMQNLARESEIYNEYHAQIVHLAKSFCRKRKPLCPACPLEQECRFAQQASAGKQRDSDD